MNFLSFKSVAWTIIVGVSVVAIVLMSTSLMLIYNAAYSNHLIQLEDNAKTLANIVEAMAQFDEEFSQDDHPEGARGATLSKIAKAIAFQSHRRPSEELTIGYLESGTIQLMRQDPSGTGIEDVTRLPYDGILAQPQYHALQGESGSGEMLDYRRVRVLAGYAPVPTLSMGLVYKIDLAEVRAPYYRATTWAILIGIVVVSLGAFGLSAVMGPLAHRTEEAQIRYALVEEALDDGIWDWNMITGEDFLSPRWKEILGFTDDEVPNIESSFFDRIHADDKERASEAISRHLEENERFAVEIRMQHKDGSYRWVLSRGEAIKDIEGTPVRMVGSITDITERKEIESALLKSTNSLAEAQRISHVGNWEWKVTTNELFWSDEIYRIFGLLPQQFGATYDAFLESVHPEDRESLDRAVNIALEGGESYDIEHRVVLPTGEVRHVHERAVISCDSEGQATRMFGTVRDITQHTIAAQQLRDSLREKEVLLKEIHHRVKNNLQIISSLLNLQSVQIEDSEARSLFEESKDRVSAMALVHEKLYGSDNLSEIDFGDYLQSLVDIISYSTVLRSAKCMVDVQNIMLDIDTAIPCALIANELISNSMKHAFHDKNVAANGQSEVRSVMTLEDKNSLVFRISDNGCGFPEDVDFRNTESLGLQIVNTLIEQLDGTIELCNEGGATFTMRFAYTNKKMGV